MASDAVAILASDWTPFLVKAPHLIKQLGFCIALAATRQAAQIQLNESNLEHKSLASNLLVIANQGQNAFMEAYSDMLQIGIKTNGMGCNGGTMDQIADLFGDTAADRATKRLLSRIQADVSACDQRGKRTAGEFNTWLKGVQRLHTAVVGVQSETSQSLGAAENDMKALTANVARMNNDLSKVHEERIVAQEFHAQALHVQLERENMLNSAAVQVAHVGMAAGYGLIGAIIGAGVSSYLSASAAQKVAMAEAELSQKRKDARELDYAIKDVEIDLGMFQTESEGLKYLLRAISKVLGLLAELTENIVSLVSYFKLMNSVIEELVLEHESQLKKIAADQANGEELDDADFEAFQRSAKSMKKLALTVHSLSTLYSTVITDIINPGFSLVVRSAHHVDGSSALVVAQKDDRLEAYLLEADQQCRVSATEAKEKLRLRIDEIDRSKPTKRQRRNSKKQKKGVFSMFSSRQ